MITYVFDEMFYSPARVLVNPVNTVGTMGAWLAKDFKRFFPKMFLAYQELCQTDRFETGQLMLYRATHRWVLNFPVKGHFRASITTENIEAGLQKFAAIYAAYDMTLVSFPALGYDQEGLDWHADVRPLMESYLRPLPIMVFIHMPPKNGDTDQPNRNIRGIRNWLNSAHADVSFHTFWQQLTSRIDDNLVLDTSHTDRRDRKSFRLKAESAQGRASLRIIPAHDKPIFLPEVALRDLWDYVKRAGYVLPQNFPAGLDVYGPYLVPILALVDVVRPVQLAQRYSEPVNGLHFVPPLASQDRVREVAAQLVEDKPQQKPAPAKPTSEKPASESAAPTKPITGNLTTDQPAPDKPVQAKPTPDSAVSDKPAEIKPALDKSTLDKVDGDKRVSDAATPDKSTASDNDNAKSVDAASDKSAPDKPAEIKPALDQSTLDKSDGDKRVFDAATPHKPTASDNDNAKSVDAVSNKPAPDNATSNKSAEIKPALDKSTLDKADGDKRVSDAATPDNPTASDNDNAKINAAPDKSLSEKPSLDISDKPEADKPASDESVSDESTPDKPATTTS
ncbi:macro domain-containing protein [Phototrophicus methaneseepsis]|uniref:Macro domain-containing protein n=1 Tax=Phototrophicus methaneseepsis TaxID=2710758 RepID=A0A7S8IEX2_9CHLR|nr:macro domain-containing protein [Phototrophicus methaneseepsis]QPC82288.1 macro domain-containing protein [Phototrophicus methaneseepsis]